MTSESGQEPPDTPPSPARRHGWRWALLPILVAGGILLVAMWLLRPRSPEPVDESPLQPRAVAGPTNGNAVVFLDQALTRLRSTNELSQLIRKPRPGVSAESRRLLVEQVLDAERETLALVHRAFLAPDCELVEPPRMTTNRDSRGWSRLARLAALPARERPGASHPPEDWGLALQLVRLGHRLEGAGGTFLDYLDAWAVKRAGLDLLRRLATRSSGNTEELAGHARTLAAFTANAPGLTNAIRWNFQEFLLLMAAGIGQLPPESPVLSQSRTRALRARRSLELMSTIAAPPGSPCPIPESPETSPSALKLLFRGNPLGTVLEGMGESDDRSLLLSRNRENITVSATRLVLALRAFELESGTLPGSLSELVPRWLDAVPADDHDGQPIRWSRERRLLWSVGRDGRDDGGIERNATRKEADMVFDDLGTPDLDPDGDTP